MIHDLVPLRFPSGCRAARAGCTRRSTGTLRAPATSSSSTPCSRRARWSSCSASRRRRCVVAYPGVDDSRPRASRRARPALRPHRGDARAAQEPRRRCRARRSRTATRWPSSARKAGGRSRRSTGPAWSGSATSTTTSSRACTAAPPRSSTRRASRGSACRSSRRWRAACRSSAPRTSRWTRPAATPPCAPIPNDPAAIGAAHRGGARGRDELVPRGLAHAARFTLERDRPRHARGVLRDARRPRHLAARPDAGRHGALHRALLAAQRVRAVRPGGGRTRTGDDRPRCLVVPARPARGEAPRLDVLHCPTFRGPVTQPPCRW